MYPIKHNIASLQCIVFCNYRQHRVDVWLYSTVLCTLSRQVVWWSNILTLHRFNALLSALFHLGVCRNQWFYSRPLGSAVLARTIRWWSRRDQMHPEQQDESLLVRASLEYRALTCGTHLMSRKVVNWASESTCFLSQKNNGLQQTQPPVLSGGATLHHACEHVVSD